MKTSPSGAPMAASGTAVSAQAGQGGAAPLRDVALCQRRAAVQALQVALYCVARIEAARRQGQAAGLNVGFDGAGQFHGVGAAPRRSRSIANAGWPRRASAPLDGGVFDEYDERHIQDRA